MCNGFANFVIPRDKKSKFKFAALQSRIGQQFVQKFNLSPEILSIVLVEDNQHYMRSAAVLRIFKELKFPWWTFYGSIIVPPFIRDTVYNIIAKYRYSVFGKRDECTYNPTWKDRFLTDGDDTNI